MVKHNPKGASWIAQGPLGPWGRKLGFRWVFPFGTLPLPFHPLLLPLTLLVSLLMAAWSAYGAIVGVGGEWSWLAFLLVAALLGLLLSIPIVSWFVAATGGLYVQAVLFPLAMILLAIDVLTGRAHPALGLLPASYAALFAVQALFGKAYLRRIERERASFQVSAAGQASFALAAFMHESRDLITGCDIVRLQCPALGSTKKAAMYHWLSHEDASALEAAWGAYPMPGWTLVPDRGGVLLTRPCQAPPAHAIRLTSGPLRTPLGLVTGLRAITARGAGKHWRLVHGQGQVIKPIPVFSLFRWTSLTVSGRNHWTIGFPRRTIGDLPMPEGQSSRTFSHILPPRGEDGGMHDKDGLAELHALIAARNEALARALNRVRAGLPRFWARLPTLTQATREDVHAVDLLVEEPTLLPADKAAQVLDWIDRLVDASDRWSLLCAARLLGSFPDAVLAPLADRLHAQFNSRRVALQWQLGEGFAIRDLPKHTPIYYGTIAGFGLLLAHRPLYERLAAIDPRMAKVLRELDRQIAAGEPGLSQRYTTISRPTGLSSGRFATG